MKSSVNHAVVCLSLSIFCGLIGCKKDIGPVVREESVLRDITVETSAAMIEENNTNPRFVILDVRTPAEFATGHIKNATNIDFRSKSFRDDLSTLTKSDVYLVCCRSGGRSRSALEMMKALDFRSVFNMLGGITAWKAQNYPIEGAANN